MAKLPPLKRRSVNLGLWDYWDTASPNDEKAALVRDDNGVFLYLTLSDAFLKTLKRFHELADTLRIKTDNKAKWAVFEDLPGWSFTYPATEYFDDIYNGFRFEIRADSGDVTMTFFRSSNYYIEYNAPLGTIDEIIKLFTKDEDEEDDD